MHPLNRKLLRDLRHMRGQAIAIALVIASGMATFVMSRSTLQSLEVTQATYYEQSRFAQVWARLKRAPEVLKDRIAEISGVAVVETRVVVDVNLDVPGLREPAVGRLVSIPQHHPPTLNRLYLRQGRLPEPGRPGEALVSEAFAASHDLAPGDRLRAVVRGTLYPLTIVGIGLTPEYILQIREGELLPDQSRFGIFWLREDDLAAAYDMESAFNDVTLTLMRGASEEAVIDALDTLLEPYGGVAAYGRDDQLSNRYLTDEIRSLRAMGLIAPSIFLGVAAFLLNVVMTRIVASQREQIATLKAFGYTNFEIGRHYLQLVLLITGIGVVIGVALGARMGYGLTSIYTVFYHFPIFHYRLQPGVVVLAVAIGAAAATLGTIGAIYRAVTLPPAEAMRPEPPTVYRPTIVERLGLQRVIPESARMIMRHLERRPIKSFLSCLGIAMAVAVLILGRFAMDALDRLVDVQFFQSQRQEMTVAFVEPTSPGVLYELENLPGVLRVEPFRAVATRMYFGHRMRRIGITGVEEGSDLFRVFDADRGPLEVPERGLMISAKLAELLAVRPGQRVMVEVQEGKRPVVEVPVAALVEDYAGTNAFMHIDALRRLMQEGDVLSGAYLRVDGSKVDDLYATLKQTPRVAGVSVKTAMIESFEKTITENQQRIQQFNIMFAIVIAFGVVYNTARISLAERSRELATLRVIGFTRAEISAILLGELGVLTLLAIPMGFAVGYGFAAFASIMLDTELYRIPLYISRWTFGFAAGIVIAASLISGLVVRRRLDELDLIAVLKARE